MSDKFPHLTNNESGFPYVEGVDVYKYDNGFDYSRFDASQMEVMICTVPWDMGEAHVGNRTISGIGNVVWFETKAKRNEWFGSIPDGECFRYTTKYKALHRDNEIVVDIPFDVASNYNYVYVKYNLFANDGSLVENESASGRNEWFWFIREVEFLAPNSTRLHLLNDAWQTFMYDIDISNMILERGHAPMFSTSVQQYLDNPVENCADLLTEDVNYGTASVVRHIDALVLNAGTMYACIATTANPAASWGSKAGGNWLVPASSYNNSDGVPSTVVFAVAVNDLDSFLVNVDAQVPQFKQTVQGVFFASTQLITLNGNFTFAGTTCYYVQAGRKTLDFVNIEKQLFGYPDEYSNIAKLYTMPYAHIEVTDENGQASTIRIEDTEGTIDVSAALSLSYPFINIDAHLLGVGGNGSATVTFRNIDSRSFNVSGQWYDTLIRWQVPTFAIIQQASTEYDYSTHFDRAQRVVDYETAYNNANANADLVTDNALLTTTANTAITNISNGSAGDTLDNTRSYNFGVMDTDNDVIGTTATSTIAAAEEQAAVATASAVAGGVVGAIASAATGNVAGAVTSAVNGIIGGATTIANTAITTGLTAAKASIAQTSNEDHAELSTSKTQRDTATQQATATSMTGAQNTLTSGQAANTSATQKANANRSRTQAQSAIANAVAQAALREPMQYGNFANGGSAVTKPIGLFAHVVTQSKNAIASAGDEFLRYGYMLDRQWHFDGNWNVGHYFTYWKLRDFWISGLNVPDMYVDKIRFFLYGGVTVWRNPADIGNVTIYDNFPSKGR